MIFKCSACGANLKITTETVICTCEYCGTMQTIDWGTGLKAANLAGQSKVDLYQTRLQSPRGQLELRVQKRLDDEINNWLDEIYDNEISQRLGELPTACAIR